MSKDEITTEYFLVPASSGLCIEPNRTKTLTKPLSDDENSRFRIEAGSKNRVAFKHVGSGSYLRAAGGYKSNAIKLGQRQWWTLETSNTPHAYWIKCDDYPNAYLCNAYGNITPDNTIYIWAKEPYWTQTMLWYFFDFESWEKHKDSKPDVKAISSGLQLNGAGDSEEKAKESEQKQQELEEKLKAAEEKQKELETEKKDIEQKQQDYETREKELKKKEDELAAKQKDASNQEEELKARQDAASKKEDELKAEEDAESKKDEGTKANEDAVAKREEALKVKEEAASKREKQLEDREKALAAQKSSGDSSREAPLGGNTASSEELQTLRDQLASAKTQLRESEGMSEKLKAKDLENEKLRTAFEELKRSQEASVARINSQNPQSSASSRMGGNIMGGRLFSDSREMEAAMVGSRTRPLGFSSDLQRPAKARGTPIIVQQEFKMLPKLRKS